MTPEDRSKVIKLLGMTGSDHSGEVLNAIRMANAHLVKNNMTWAQFCGAAPMSSRPATPHKPSFDEMFGDREQMFDVVLKASRGTGFHTMMADIYNQWQRTGRMSEKQDDTLHNAYQRAKERQRK